MKIKLKIFVSLLMIIALNISLNADELDDGLKKQCQYLVYGNGRNNNTAGGIMIDIILGARYAQDISSNSSTPNGIIMDKACKNALENRGKYGFQDDYMWQVLKLVSIKYK